MPDEPVPSDPLRRRFFRLFAGEVTTSVGSMIGVAQALQQESTAAARDLLGIVDPAPAAPPTPRAQGPWDASTAGYRAPFRFEDDAVFAWDQRQLPDVLQELEIQGAADAVNAINDGAVAGSAVHAQLAAATVSLVAARAWDSRPFARRATIRGSANAFRITRPGSAAVAQALDRLLALQDVMGLEIDGKVLADALRREAEEIIIEATEDHGRIAEHAPSALPGGPNDALHVLTMGSTGPMGSGVFGTALGVIASLHHGGRPVHALVAETRPGLEGARIAAWELRQGGVPHAIVTDAAAPGCIAAGEVGAVLVTADRVAANGDILATAGSYALALAASAAGVPFVVCVATTAVDPATRIGDDATIEEGRPARVLVVNGKRVAPEGTQIRNPIQDLVPAGLVTALVTEEGVLRAPFEPEIAAAVARSAERRSVARGFKALLAQREAEAAGATWPPPPPEAPAPSAGAELSTQPPAGPAPMATVAGPVPTPPGEASPEPGDPAPASGAPGASEP
jgi:methylthioribose-1-phosphate isomerase